MWLWHEHFAKSKRAILLSLLKVLTSSVSCDWRQCALWRFPSLDFVLYSVQSTRLVSVVYKSIYHFWNRVWYLFALTACLYFAKNRSSVMFALCVFETKWCIMTFLFLTELGMGMVGVVRNDLARQYQQKLSALELKRVEVMRLNQDFESKMRNKEVSHSSRKWLFASVSLSLSASVAVCLSVCPSLSLPLPLPPSLSVYLCIYLSIRLSVYPPVC